jgi:hypothetical protein
MKASTLETLEGYIKFVFFIKLQNLLKDNLIQISNKLTCLAPIFKVHSSTKSLSSIK